MGLQGSAPVACGGANYWAPAWDRGGGGRTEGPKSEGVSLKHVPAFGVIEFGFRWGSVPHALFDETEPVFAVSKGFGQPVGAAGLDPIETATPRRIKQLRPTGLGRWAGPDRHREAPPHQTAGPNWAYEDECDLHKVHAFPNWAECGRVFVTYRSHQHLVSMVWAKSARLHQRTVPLDPAHRMDTFASAATRRRKEQNGIPREFHFRRHWHNAPRGFRCFCP